MIGSPMSLAESMSLDDWISHPFQRQGVWCVGISSQRRLQWEMVSRWSSHTAIAPGSLTTSMMMKWVDALPKSFLLYPRFSGGACWRNRHQGHDVFRFPQLVGHHGYAMNTPTWTVSNAMNGSKLSIQIQPKPEMSWASDWSWPKNILTQQEMELAHRHSDPVVYGL